MVKDYVFFSKKQKFISLLHYMVKNMWTKVFGGVEIRALWRPLKLLHISLSKPCLHGLRFVYMCTVTLEQVWTLKWQKIVILRHKTTFFTNVCLQLCGSRLWKKHTVYGYGSGVHILLVIKCIITKISLRSSTPCS